MKKQFLGMFVIITLVFFGCSKDDNPTAPDSDTGGNEGTTLTLSGSESRTFNNMQVTVMLDSDWVEITISDANATHGVMLMSDYPTSGEYNIPVQYTGAYSDAEAHKVYDFYEGTVTITSISSNSVKGTFNAKGYLFDMNTLQYDSTKVLNVTGNISK